MNETNTKRILNDFPEFFRHKDDMKQSLIGFGLDCADGWYNLIYKLCKDIKEYYLTKYEGVGYDDEKYYHEVPKHFEVVQIKEKFGSLRFYITFAPEEIHDMIQEAELKSYYICEHCGKENPEYKKGDKTYKSFYRDELPWILTLCDDCLKEHLDKRGLQFNSYISDWQKKNKAPVKLQ